jgi:hypothetical protein
VTSLVFILMYQGRKDDAARHADVAEKAILGWPDEDYLRSWIQNARVSLSLFADDEDEEIVQGRLAMSLAQRTGNPTMLALGSYALGWALRHRHPDEALGALDRSVALARRGASTTVLAVALSYGARAAASLGDPDEARARLRDALEESLRNDDWSLITISLDVEVDIFSYRGEAHAAAVLASAVETTLAPLRYPLCCQPRGRPGGADRQPGPSPGRTGRQLLRARPRRGCRHEPTRRPRLRTPEPVIPDRLQPRRHQPHRTAEPLPPSRTIALPHPCPSAASERLGTVTITV